MQYESNAERAFYIIFILHQAKFATVSYPLAIIDRFDCIFFSSMPNPILRSFIKIMFDSNF